MKRFILLVFVLGILFAANAFLSCSKVDDLKDAADSLKEAAGSQVIVAVLVSNGTEVKSFTEESGGKTLDVAITGENKALVKGTMQSDISLGTYILNTDIIKPSEDDPLQFTLVFSADGYLTTSRSYYFAGNGTKYDYVILTNLSAQNAGVDSTTQTKGSATNGVVDAEVSVTTDGNKASVVIPQGVTLKSEDGTPLSGNLTTTIAHFDAGDPRALAAFPGSLTPIIKDEEGNTEPSRFVSAGFVSIDIADGAGNKAATIENGSLSVSIAASSATVNPDTEKVIQAGDKIPLWSFNEKSGQWSYESEVTLEADDLYIPLTRSYEKGLRVKTSVTHLSSYNLDYHEDSCAISSKINIKNRIKGKPLNLDVQIKGEPYPQRVMVEEDFLQFNNAPKQRKVTIQVATDIEQPEEFNAIVEIIKLVKTIIDPQDFIENPNALIIDDLCAKEEHTLDAGLFQTQ